MPGNKKSDEKTDKKKFKKYLKNKNGNLETTVIYTYDKAGNRISQKETNQSDGKAGQTEETSYTYNGLDQLLSSEVITNGTVSSDLTFTYDDNGNQLAQQDTVKQISTTNTYDVDNRLVTATVKQGDQSLVQENAYNGNGQRIFKKEGSKQTNYFYQDGVVSYTTDAENQKKATQNLLGLEGNVIATERSASDSISYYLYNKDIQGSTSSVLDETASADATYSYTDFGETTINGTNNSQNEICYTGGIYDDSTGLYYLNARYYDPETGRFLTEDSYRGESGKATDWHLYAYCDNNPINYVDPSGHARNKINYFYMESFIYSYLKKATKDGKKLKKKISSIDPRKSYKGVKSFVNLVKTGGTYDVKNKKSYKNKYMGVKRGIDKMYFRKRALRFDDPGNIIFGFFARTCGFTLRFSQIGAGLYQIRSSGLNPKNIMSYGDDPHDTKMIKWGAQIYEHERNYFK